MIERERARLIFANLLAWLLGCLVDRHLLFGICIYVRRYYVARRRLVFSRPVLSGIRQMIVYARKSARSLQSFKRRANAAV
ncbi:hypothetical protein IWX91DRAFT_62211 [Phyllosticta citricarpa]